MRPFQLVLTFAILVLAAAVGCGGDGSTTDSGPGSGDRGSGGAGGGGGSEAGSGGQGGGAGGGAGSGGDAAADSTRSDAGGGTDGGGGAGGGDAAPGDGGPGDTPRTEGGGMSDGGTSAAMSFFITSRTGSADLGGLAGADKICGDLASAVGVGQKTWKAYLTASASAGEAAVNARDRIGTGPWYNARGVKIADTVAELHGSAAAGMNLNGETALDEKGSRVPGRTSMPNEHDILTGATLDGMAYPASPDKTCANWTSAMAGAARVGHFDRTGGGEFMNSWNSAHETRGCDLATLRSSGGAGRLYCFAVD